MKYFDSETLIAKSLISSQLLSTDLSSNLASMTLNVVDHQVSILKTTPWFDVQLRHVVGNLRIGVVWSPFHIFIGWILYFTTIKLHLGSRLSKEAANFAGEGDPVLVLERADSVDENLKDWDLVEKSKKIITKYWNVRIVSMKT